MEFQKVEVYVCIAGDYAAFHEISFYVEYDITNDIQLGYKSLEELESFDFDEEGDGRIDYEIREAILDKSSNKYYVEW
jgi:hypothetical protein